jgi:alkanesulfonate monooxygenase SsuD/methylene tetrahydromethanopterin reductase-like flavin-dependent oxidoreductase (luciferase family)
MEFGVFDHLDRNDAPLEVYYQDRLDFVEACERAGFYAYHLAEHHLTDLSMAPSPNLFLAAVAQRTRRLRFGPMIYAAPLYHPLRLLEEICMLDQLSGGRLEMGFGRGAVPAEIRFFGIDPAEAEGRYREAVNYILGAMLEGRVPASADTHGMALTLPIPPFQKPHPPLWYGVHSPDSAERAARAGMNVISLDPVLPTQACFERYGNVRRSLKSLGAAPRLGLGRFVVIARDGREAAASAARAYRRWHDSFTYLSSRMGFALNHARPRDYEAVCEEGRAVAGDPGTVAAFIHAQMRATGANYFVGQFAFGDLSRQETLASIELFAGEVMPALRKASPPAQAG